MLHTDDILDVNELSRGMRNNEKGVMTKMRHDLGGSLFQDFIDSDYEEKAVWETIQADLKKLYSDNGWEMEKIESSQEYLDIKDKSPDFYSIIKTN